MCVSDHKVRVLAAAFLAVVAIGVSLLYGAPAAATMVLPLDLKQMTDQAGRILVGHCEDLTQELDENGMPATYVHLTVLDGIKGVATGDRILIKQFGAARRPLKVAEGENA